MPTTRILKLDTLRNSVFYLLDSRNITDSFIEEYIEKQRWVYVKMDGDKFKNAEKNTDIDEVDDVLSFHNYGKYRAGKLIIH